MFCKRYTHRSSSIDKPEELLEQLDETTTVWTVVLASFSNSKLQRGTQFAVVFNARVSLTLRVAIKSTGPVGFWDPHANTDN